MGELLKVTVDGLWRQGEKNLAIRLLAQEGSHLPAWQAGAHIDLHLPSGLIRQYSLTGQSVPGEGYVICVARESTSRGGSHYIHDNLRPGQTLLISPPRNLFPLQQGGSVLLMAAGIGITPLYAMALQRERAGTPFELHYYVKNRQIAAFTRELAQPFSQGQCIIHCSSEGDSPRKNLADTLGAPQANQHLYVCGPQGFMLAVKDAAIAKHWLAPQIHSEAFQPVTSSSSIKDAETFTVTLSSTGEKWPVPANKSIARVLQDNGVEVPLSCEMGMCGACLTPVIEGIVDHRDSVQSPAEKTAATQHIALCCSRSHSDNLVIDL